jgi:hypothetical protein
LSLRIKNWKRFQHFKFRRPIWIKLYKDILDDIEWHTLEPLAAKHLLMLWLVASEDEGALPSVKELAFRLRTTENEVESSISKLSHWLEQDDIKLISNGYQNDSTEKSIKILREEKSKRRVGPVETVDNSRSDGADDGGNGLGAIPPPAPTLSVDPEVVKLGEAIRKRQEQGRPT